MKLRVLFALLVALAAVPTSAGYLTPRDNGFYESVRIREASITQSNGKYLLVLIDREGRQKTVRFALTTVFHIRTKSGIDGTYAYVNATEDRAFCTIFVRNVTTKRIWDELITRYQPGSTPLPVDVIPTEYVPTIAR